MILKVTKHRVRVRDSVVDTSYNLTSYEIKQNPTTLSLLVQILNIFFFMRSGCNHHCLIFSFLCSLLHLEHTSQTYVEEVSVERNTSDAPQLHLDYSNTFNWHSVMVSKALAGAQLRQWEVWSFLQSQELWHLDIAPAVTQCWSVGISSPWWTLFICTP